MLDELYAPVRLPLPSTVIAAVFLYVSVPALTVVVPVYEFKFDKTNFPIPALVKVVLVPEIVPV